MNEEFFEPERTGISYSFTADGHFEEAYYRAIANRTSYRLVLSFFFRVRNHVGVLYLEE